MFIKSVSANGTIRPSTKPKVRGSLTHGSYSTQLDGKTVSATIFIRDENEMKEYAVTINRNEFDEFTKLFAR